MGVDPRKETAVLELFETARIHDLLKRLWIRGVEVTQGIQHYEASEHLTDVADQGPDNSVQIVAGKPAWVRVYLRALFQPKPGVSGTLRVFKRNHGILWAEIAVISPQPPGTVTAEATIAYDAERGDIDRTLNFIVPADTMCGHLRFEIQVTDGTWTDTTTVSVSATMRQTLRMRIVPVSYDGTDSIGNPLTLPAPTLADAEATAAWSLLVYPVQSTPNISFTAEVELTFPLTGAPASPGGCAQSWLNLNQLVAQAKTADGNQPDTFYYGLAPSGVPIGTNSGCASSGVTSGRVGGQTTMAHEFGHALGYPHAPCGSVGTGDPLFPAYEPYDAGGVPGASIGEYGLDISTGDVKSPATVRDYMSYCSPRWISLFNYGRALNHATLNPQTVCNDRFWLDWDEILIDPWWWLRRRFPEPDPPPWYEEVVKPVDPRERVISLIGVRDLAGRLEVRSITRTLAVPEVQGGQRTAVVAELVDDQGKALAAGPVMRLVGRGGCSCSGGGEDDDARGPYLFQAFLPDVGRGAALRLVEGEKELWREEAPAESPKAPSLEASVTKRGQLDLRWRVGGSHRPLEVWIRWTTGGKQEPQVLFVGSGSGHRRFETVSLPTGAITLDVVAHDGFSPVNSRPVRVRLPKRPPTVSILHPYEHRTFQTGRTLRLQGVATESGGRRVDPQNCVWRLDRKEVARGFDVFVTAPEAGKHVVTFTAAGEGGKSEARARITTVDPEREAKTKSNR